MFCNEDQGPQKMEELFLHLLKDRNQNVKGGSLSGVLKYSFFIFGYTNKHDHIHRINFAEITLIVSSVITTKINRHPSDLQQLCDQITIGFVMIVIKFMMITSFMQILISFAMCGEIPGEMDSRRPSVAIWRNLVSSLIFLNELSVILYGLFIVSERPTFMPASIGLRSPKGSSLKKYI